MIWDGKRLSEITESDLRKILESGIEEHKRLEYKAELYPTTDAGKKDFLIDICAFANAESGILLIGIPEQRDSNAQPTGVPDLDKFTGIDSANPESLLLSYDPRVVSESRSVHSWNPAQSSLKMASIFLQCGFRIVFQSLIAFV